MKALKSPTPWESVIMDLFDAGTKCALVCIQHLEDKKATEAVRAWKRASKRGIVVAKRLRRERQLSA